MEPQFVRLDAVRAFGSRPVSGQPLFGADAMLNLIRFEPGRQSPSTAIRTSSSGSLEGMQRCVVEGVAHGAALLRHTSCPEASSTRRTAVPEGSLVLDRLHARP
jgi:hypothetical protein